jgi:4-amino-4-deoxy-L-arabinose transferase-like glycosyltransferase
MYFYENNYYLWSRIFLKTEASGDNIEAEGSRTGHAFNLLDYISDTVIPRGIYPRGISFYVDGSGGSTLDFPLYEIFYVFGSITVLFFLFKFFLFIYRSLKIISNGRDESNELILVVTTCCLLVVSSFFDGSFLQYTFVTPFTGLIIGRMYFLVKNRLSLFIKYR